MATVTALTAARMLEIEAESIVDGHVDALGHLILERHDGVTIDAGYIVDNTNSVTIPTAQTVTGDKKFTGHVDIDLFGANKNLNFRPATDATGASMGIQAKDFNGDGNWDGLQVNGYDGVSIGTKQGKMFQVRRDGGVDIDLFGALAGNRFLNFRPALNDGGANLGIQAVDWNGDGNFDGLSINGNDGFGLKTTAGTVVRILSNGQVYSSGNESRFGGGSNGAAGASYVRLADDFTRGTVSAQGAPANVQLDIYSKGAGIVTIAGPSMAFNNLVNGANWVTIDSSGELGAPFRETSLAIRHNNVLKRVYANGAADSGGAGYRTLLVTN